MYPRWVWLGLIAYAALLAVTKCGYPVCVKMRVLVRVEEGGTVVSIFEEPEGRRRPKGCEVGVERSPFFCYGFGWRSSGRGGGLGGGWSGL